MKRHHAATLRQLQSTNVKPLRRAQSGRAGGRRLLLIMLTFAVVLIMGWGQCAKTRVSGARTVNPSSR
jgi:hypothetical protein